MTDLFALEENPRVGIIGASQRYPVRRVYCVGGNYAEHTREMGGDPAREAPFFFSKPPSAVVAGGGALDYPPQTSELHHEVELVVALDKVADGVSVAEAPACIYGYAVGIDLTRRDLQAQAKKLGRPWDTGKAFDQSAPLSAITPAASIGALDSGAITLRVNGQLRQQGDLAQMIWSIPEVIAQLSQYFRLYPGDLVFTGTPAGVGAVERGDVLDASIEAVGELQVTLV